MTAAAHIPEHATAAHMERLLMRWPFDIRLRLKLAVTKQLEAQQAKRARAAAMKQIRAGLVFADLATLKNIAAELQQAQEAVNG